MPKSIILDTDTGVDDALAICLAMRSPELRVLAITAVHGNIPVGTACANIQRTLDVIGPDHMPSVACGAERPLRRPPTYADEVHGWDGLGGVTRLRGHDGQLLYPESSVPLDSRSATQSISDAIQSSPVPVTLVAVGPLTNIALAIRHAPDTVRRLDEIVVMGGAFRQQGNASPVAEFNIYGDPDAAQIVFDFGVPVVIFPLDVTEQVVLTRAHVEAGTTHDLGRFVHAITAHTMEFGRRVEQVDGCYVHDALAVAYLIRSALFQWVERHVAVETEGRITRGQTVADLREPPRFVQPPNARIAMQVDANAFLELFKSRVLCSG